MAGLREPSVESADRDQPAATDVLRSGSESGEPAGQLDEARDHGGHRPLDMTWFQRQHGSELAGRCRSNHRVEATELVADPTH